MKNSLQSAIESFESGEQSIVKKSTRKVRSTKVTSKKVVTESTSSSKEESIETIEKQSSIEQKNHSSEVVSSQQEEIMNGNRELETRDDEQQKLKKKKVKKSKKSDTEKENISVVSAQNIVSLLEKFLKIFAFLYCNICLTLLNFVVRFACKINFYHCLIFYVKLNGIKIFNRLSMLNTTSIGAHHQSTLKAPTKPPITNGRDRTYSNTHKNHNRFNSCSLNHFINNHKSTSTNDLSIRRKSDSLNCLNSSSTNNKPICKEHKKKITYSSNVQLHDDDLSWINVKSLVRISLESAGIATLAFYLVNCI